MKKDPATNVVPERLRAVRRLTLGIVYGAGLWALALGAAVILSLLSQTYWHSLISAAAWAAGLAGLGLLFGLLGLFLPQRAPRLKTEPPVLVRIIERLGVLFQWIPAVFAIALILGGLGFLATGREVTTADAFAFVLAAPWIVTALALSNRKTLDLAFSAALLSILGSSVVGAFAIDLQTMPAFAAWPVEPLRRYALGATLVPAVFLGLLGWTLYKSFLLPVMTESARLFTPSPSNVPNQEKIRQRGFELLQDIHNSDAGYTRVVVLAHSLGTAVGYNLLAYYWGKVNDQLDHATTGALRGRVEACAGALTAVAPAGKPFAAWRAAVRAYGRALAAPKSGAGGAGAGGAKVLSPWRISDFITIGSPLTYAAFLMEPSDAAFREEVTTYRRYALCPPQPLNAGPGFTMPSGKPHHAALFAATCWTNLFFPSRGLVWGDVIGGPIAGPLQGAAIAKTSMRGGLEPPRLGYGVLDVTLRHDPRLGWFSHNDYWPWPKLKGASPPADTPVATPPAYIQAMRSAFHFFEDPAKADSFLAGLTA